MKILRNRDEFTFCFTMTTKMDKIIIVLRMKCVKIIKLADFEALKKDNFRFFTFLERLDVSGHCSDSLVLQLAQHCPGLRHLSANRSKTLSDAALGAISGTQRIREGFVRGCKKLKRLEISGCPLITASKIVSLLLFLPRIQYLHCPERLDQVIKLLV